MKEHIFLLILALVGCYGWGYSIGLKRGTKDFQPLIDRAMKASLFEMKKYEASLRIISKLRNRLQARRIIEMKKIAINGK